MAIEKENIEIVKLLLANDKLDINILNILNIFLLHSKLYHSITFKIILFNYIESIFFNEIQNHIFQWNKNYIFQWDSDIWFHKSALYLAVEKENIEIVKLLLTNDKLDINILNILNIYFITFKIISFNPI